MASDSRAGVTRRTCGCPRSLIELCCCPEESDTSRKRGVDGFRRADAWRIDEAPPGGSYWATWSISGDEMNLLTDHPWRLAGQTHWLTNPSSSNFFGDEPPVSPGGTVDPDRKDYFPKSADDVSSKPPKSAPFQNYRRELSAADSPNIPSISQDPPTAPLAQVAPWGSNEHSPSPATAMLPPSRSFFDEPRERARSSHSKRPSTSRTDTSDSLEPWRNRHDRRPSVASEATANSQASSEKTTGTKPKRKLTGVFGGEDHRSSQPYSDKTLSSSNISLRTRTNSVQTKDEGRVSPTSSRPRTPLPSSDVVPWVFQDFQVRRFDFRSLNMSRRREPSCCGSTP